MNDDAHWLKQFVDERSEEAFACLVRRHVDLVYSAALRQLKNRELAENVTQLAFTALAPKAESFRKETVLAARLLVTTRFLCLDKLKFNARRLRHEKLATHMANTIDHPARPSAWGELAEHLDAALASLSTDDRRVITLRYFNQQSPRDVADSMGTSLMPPSNASTAPRCKCAHFSNRGALKPKSSRERRVRLALSFC